VKVCSGLLPSEKKKKKEEEEEKKDDIDGGGGGDDDNNDNDKLCCSVINSEAPDIMVKLLTLIVYVQRSGVQTQKLTTLTEFFHCSLNFIYELLTASFSKLSRN
jgi:hypothetical protein